MKGKKEAWPLLLQDTDFGPSSNSQHLAHRRSIVHAAALPPPVSLSTKVSLKTGNMNGKCRGSWEVLGPWVAEISPVVQLSVSERRHTRYTDVPAQGMPKAEGPEGLLAQHSLLDSFSQVNPLDKKQQQESPPKYPEGEEAVQLLPEITLARVRRGSRGSPWELHRVLVLPNAGNKGVQRHTWLPHPY